MSTSDRRLDEAAAQLRGQERGLGKVARRVLRRTVTSPRRTSYLRLTGEYDGVRVATVAVRALLVERLDAALVDAAVQKITMDVKAEQLTALDLEIVVRFGTYMDDAAHLARTQVLRALRDLAGSADVLPLPPVTVHVVDVASGDPRTTTPYDE